MVLLGKLREDLSKVAGWLIDWMAFKCEGFHMEFGPRKTEDNFVWISLLQ